MGGAPTYVSMGVGANGICDVRTARSAHSSQHWPFDEIRPISPPELLCPQPHSDVAGLRGLS